MRQTFAEKVLKETWRRQSITEFKILSVALLCVAILFLLGAAVYNAYFHNTHTGSPEFTSERPSGDPPFYLNIRGERWYIYPDASLSDDRVLGGGIITGRTSCEERLIWYNPSVKSSSLFRETLWHEIFHAAYCSRSSSMNANWSRYVQDQPEHEVVYEAGMFLPGFVHDNPEFMKWAEDWK